MAEAVLNPQEQQYLTDWNRARGPRRQAARRAAWQNYGPRSFRQPSGPALNSMLRSSPDEVYDDQGSDDLQSHRFGAQPAARRRLNQSWQAATQARGSQADAVTHRAQRFAQLQAQRRARRGEKTSEAQIEAEAAMFIRQAYARLWDGVQEAVADLALAFWGVLAVIFVPVQATLFFVRLLSGVFGQIQWRGVTVSRIPPFNWVTGPLHAGRLLLNTLLFIVWAALIGGAFYLIVLLASNPLAKLFS